MSCDLLTLSKLRACKNFVGGLENIYLFNFVKEAFTVTAKVATAINPLVLAVYEYEIDGDTHNLVQNFVSYKDAGTSVNTQTLTFTLKGVDAITSNELEKLIYGKIIAVIKDRNGKYLAFGLDDGMDFNIDQVSGSAKADLIGYTLTGVSTTKQFAPFLDTATVTALLGKIPLVP